MDPKIIIREQNKGEDEAIGLNKHFLLSNTTYIDQMKEME